MMPGAAEMYMGFMKTGLSLMLVFLLIITVGGWLNQTLLALFSVIIWFYSFFHANHIASLNDEEFSQVKDEYLFGMEFLPGAEGVVEKHHTVIACLLIFIGVCFLWNSVANLLYEVLPNSYLFIARTMRIIGNYVPSMVIGIAIIVSGIKMISGTKIEMGDLGTKRNAAENKEVSGKGEE